MKPHWLALPLLGCITNDPVATSDDEGTRGVDRLGRIAVEWEVVDGVKQVSDDFSLGPAGVQLFAASKDQSLWPTGTVPYCIHTEQLNSDPCIIRKALANLSVDGGTDTTGCTVSHARGMTPLHFQEYSCAAAAGLGTSFIDYISDTGTSGSDNTTAGNGHPGFTIHLPTFDQRSVQHETGHAMGFVHEQQRTDFAQHVKYYADCVDTLDHQKNFNPNTAAALLTPYDTQSIMQYPSYSLSLDGDSAAYTGSSCPPSSSVGVNTCPTMLFIDPDPNAMTCTDHGWRAGAYVATKSPGLTGNDIDAIYQVYEPSLAACATGQGLASESAAGDLDGDGYDDLAVSANGSVQLYKGTMNGLVAWRTLRATDFPGITVNPASFGAALAIHAVAGNPAASLFVGTPGYNTGVVFMYAPVAGVPSKPSTGPAPLMVITPPVATHNFGRSLVAGSFTSTNRDQLAVGAGDTAGTNGRVELLDYSGGAWSSVKSFLTPNGAQADGFGLAVSVGDFDNDGLDDLVVGAPAAVTNANNQGDGKVYVYHEHLGTLVLLGAVWEGQPVGATDGFGSVVRGGQVVAGGGEELVVGTPNAGAGRVQVYTWDGAGFSLNQVFNGTAVGDRFGSALRVGDLDSDGTADLAIGAPGATDGGAILMVRSTKGNAWLHAPSGLSGAWGTSIAMANFDGPGQTTGNANTHDLVVGAPGSTCAGHANAGGFGFLRNAPGTHDMTVARTFHSASAVPASVIP